MSTQQQIADAAGTDDVLFGCNWYEYFVSSFHSKQLLISENS